MSNLTELQKVVTRKEYIKFLEDVQDSIRLVKDLRKVENKKDLTNQEIVDYICKEAFKSVPITFTYEEFQKEYKTITK